MVRRGSTVRVRQRALQKPRSRGFFRSEQLALRRTCGGYGAVYGAFASRTLTELWFVYDGFVKAQESGYIAWDEPFDTGSVVEHDAQGRWIHPYDLADHARRTVWQAYEEERIQSFTPNFLYRSRDEYGEAYALLKIDDARWLISYARIRAFHFPPVTPGELAADLAAVDVVDKLAEYERGAAIAAGRYQYQAIARKIEGRNGIRDGWSCSWGSS